MNARSFIPATFGERLLAASAAIAIIDSLYNYLAPGNGIDQSGGALLVVVSSFLILAAALLVRPWAGHWPATALNVLILLGILGTALAAYFLEAFILLAIMVVAFAGWLMETIGMQQAPVGAEGRS